MDNGFRKNVIQDWSLVPKWVVGYMNKTVFQRLILPAFYFCVKQVYGMRLSEVLAGGLPLIFKLKYYLTVIFINMTAITAFARN